MVSEVFNKKFHATLGDILSSGGRIRFQLPFQRIEIDTSKIDINGIKILLKVLDLNYPRSFDEPELKKTILSPKKLNRLYELCGYPESIKNVTSKELSEHMRWIQKVCDDNNIKLEDQKWDALFERASAYDN